MICITRFKGVFLIGLKNYPRRCGENSESVAAASSGFGSSPRVRGTLQRPNTGQNVLGLIPAGAGKTNRVNGKLRFDAVIEELEDERIDSWQKSFMLAGELILPFELQDSGFYEVKLVDYLLRYSPELGLEAIQISDD